MVAGWCTLLNKVVFLDRDGVINVKAKEHDYIKCWEEFKFLPKVIDAIKLLNKNGFIVIVVSNQRGVARGIMTVGSLNEIHINMLQELQENDARIDSVYFCPHDIGECNCRKPDIGLFIRAEKDYPNLDKNSAYMIGDSKTDIEAGIRYGIRTIKIGKSCNLENYLANDLFEAASIIVRSEV